MRQLSGCDFCGGTASGTFEVLPAERDPDGAGKRMLLCDHCRDALASILDPLLGGADGRPVRAGDAAPDPDGAGPSAPSSERTSEGTEGTNEGAEGTDESDPEPAADATMASTGAGTSSRVPKGYRKVLRFLENREFPVEREAAVEMTAGAYDMEESAVDAAIDHAVSHGRLKAFDGELRRA